MLILKFMNKLSWRYVFIWRVIYLGLEFLGHMAALSFWRNLSSSLWHILHPGQKHMSVRAFPLAWKVVIVCLFYYNHPSKYKIVTRYGFHLYFPGKEWWWKSFHVNTGYFLDLLKSDEVQCIYFVVCASHVTSKKALPSQSSQRSRPYFHLNFYS
jgi:hypothetical protein